MGEAEKKWRNQYKINPQVRRETAIEGEIPMYVGFDDRLKPFEELTPEEQENYLARYKRDVILGSQIQSEEVEK